VNLSEIRAEVRDYLRDESTPYLFSDTQLNRYINRAEEEACRRADILFKRQHRIGIAYPKTAFKLPSYIKRVERVVLESTGEVIPQTTEEQLYRDWGPWESVEDTIQNFLIQRNKIRTAAAVATSDALLIDCWTLPTSQMERDADEPQIPTEYHHDLAYWACHQAYLRNDSETNSRERAAEFLAMFEARFGQIQEAGQREGILNAPKSLTLRPHGYW